nr:MAG TPA: hypothetical protein [Caudoviricetes sp.]
MSGLKYYRFELTFITDKSIIVHNELFVKSIVNKIRSS